MFEKILVAHDGWDGARKPRYAETTMMEIGGQA
jgi:hypothetical protein